jgi:hypothetical protein
MPALLYHHFHQSNPLPELHIGIEIRSRLGVRRVVLL